MFSGETYFLCEHVSFYRQICRWVFLTYTTKQVLKLNMQTVSGWNNFRYFTFFDKCCQFSFKVSISTYWILIISRTTQYKQRKYLIYVSSLRFGVFLQLKVGVRDKRELIRPTVEVLLKKIGVTQQGRYFYFERNHIF